MDLEFLVCVMFGVIWLECIGDDIYEVIVDIKMGLVKGFFSGDLVIKDK